MAHSRLPFNKELIKQFEEEAGYEYPEKYLNDVCGGLFLHPCINERSGRRVLTWTRSTAVNFYKFAYIKWLENKLVKETQ